jgi:hypothetical protein
MEIPSNTLVGTATDGDKFKCHVYAKDLGKAIISKQDVYEHIHAMRHRVIHIDYSPLLEKFNTLEVLSP